MNSITSCPYAHHEDALTWGAKSASVELRNYQTGQSMKVAGPYSNLYQDCRHQVCTSTLMSLPAYTNQKKSSESEAYDALQSNSPENIRNEAYDFLLNYQAKKGISEEHHRARLVEIDYEIQHSGIYTHTTAELEYGCQLAWRNAARCINRLFWQTLKVLDKRNVTTNEEMFAAVCDHLRMAYNHGALQATVLVMGREARLWSTQYLRFACYEQSDGSLLGDPMNRDLTKAAMELGWNKPVEERTQWDLLPIIVQCDPNTPPAWFELPEDLRPIVFLSHPDPKYDAAIKSLGLRWVAQPFVCDKAIEIGGIVYKCVPFSGWFMQTEMGRNLCDVQRYNMIPKLAALLDLDTTAAANTQLNIDRIYVEVNAAILYSFQQANITIVDHHTAAAGFMKFMQQEIKERGNTPADWIWLVPPVSSGMSVLFHQEMFNYVVKPRILDQRDPWTYYQHSQKHQNSVKKRATNKIYCFCIMLHVLRKIVDLKPQTQKKQIPINILYASTTGTAQSYAEQTKKRLAVNGYRVKLIEFDKYPILDNDKTPAIAIIITSTFGQGNAPEGGEKVEELLRKKMEEIEKSVETIDTMHNHTMNSMQWCTYAVCAIGSSAYSSFCGFGKFIDRTFEALGASRLLPITMCDALNHQYKSFNEWEDTIITTLEKLYPPVHLDKLDRKVPSLLSSSCSNQLASHIEHQSERTISARMDYIPLTFDVNINKTNEAERNGLFTKENPFRAVVLQNIELTGSSNSQYDWTTEVSEEQQLSAKIPSTTSRSTDTQKDKHRSVRLIVLKTTGLAYCPGDHVCILPENNISSINAIIRACGWHPGNALLNKPCSLAVLTNNRYTTLREILTYYVDLSSTLRSNQLNIIATYAADTNEQLEIFELGKGTQAYEKWLMNRSTIKDILYQYPSIKIPIEELIQLLPPLQPRYYSISSSYAYHPNQLHITVSIVTHTTSNGTIRKGICSNYLKQTIPLLSHDNSKNSSRQRQKPSEVRLFISPNSHFRLPGQESLTSSMILHRYIDDDQYPLHNSPILMFAVGSGIAPFRSFWQELQALENLSSTVKVKRVLFMGVRTSSDLLYAKEMQDIITRTTTDQKLLTAVIPVYSRVNPKMKKYIPDAMLDHKHMIYSMLTQDNAFIYMCGSVQACQGIESALVTIVQSCHSDKPTQMEATSIIKALNSSGRIRKDMFG